MIAYLIQAHHQEGHLKRLIDFLASPNAHFFVHIDRKVPVEAVARLLAGRTDVTILDRRIRVTWGGFSIAHANLMLLDAAHRSGRRFHRFCLLSGACFPIKTLSDIEGRLYGPEEFVCVEHRVTVRDTTGMRLHDRIAHYHFYDQLLSRLGVDRVFSRKVMRGINRVLPPRTLPSNIIFYQGSAFCALTAPCAAYVLDFLRERPDFFRYMRFIEFPEENVFQTIVKLSPFADRIDFDVDRGDRRRDHQRCLHYIDWESPRTAIFSPKTLVEQDFEALLASAAMFGRKFDETASAGLIDRLDRALASSSPATAGRAAVPSREPSEAQPA